MAMVLNLPSLTTFVSIFNLKFTLFIFTLYGLYFTLKKLKRKETCYEIELVRPTKNERRTIYYYSYNTHLVTPAVDFLTARSWRF